MLPPLHGFLGLAQGLVRRVAPRLRVFQLGFQQSRFVKEARQFLLVALQLPLTLPLCFPPLVDFRPQVFRALLVVRDALLQLGNLAADLIELRLRLVQRFGGGSVLVPQRFHLRLNAAQDRHGLFHPVFLVPHLAGFRLRLGREALPVQGQEFRL